ncbi:MAG: histidine kinase [Acutalibacter sp.]
MGRLSSNRKKREISFRNIAIVILALLVIPLFIVVVTFTSYTVVQQRSAVRNSRLSTLRVYLAQWEDTLQVAQEYLAETSANSTDFAGMIYALTKTEVLRYSFPIDEQCRVLMRSQPLLGSFFLYSHPFDYYRLICTDTYKQSDLNILRQEVMNASVDSEGLSTWHQVQLSDRTVLLMTMVNQKTVVAAMVDPARLKISGLGEREQVFFTTADRIPYCPETALGVEDFSAVSWGETTILETRFHQKYELVSLPLSGDRGYIIYAVPAKTFLQQMSVEQLILLIITFVLLMFIPLCWLMLRRWMLQPVGALTRTMEAIQGGDTAIRMQVRSNLQEVNQISHTVNTMLDIIQQQKIDAYEQKLAMQHAQLQYLQLQIRPHFFLNCLNIVYSMAGEGRDSAIQELVLDLSSYLRSIFQDRAKLVPLKTELASVESYIRIQQAGAQIPPQLKVSLDADTLKVLVPPLSLLTFVENSIKHSQRQDTPLEIRIKSSSLDTDAGKYLYVSVSDNGGGISPEEIQKLNGPQSQVYSDRHVGISNIRSRLELLFPGKATLSFRNLTDGACVELFLPIQSETTEREVE